MKKFTLFISLLIVFSGKVLAQTPSVFCTYWTGTQEILGKLDFTNQTIEAIGSIQGSNMFTLATANGYDPYRNRYYVLSNIGLVALDASNAAQVALRPEFNILQYKHLSYNPSTDQIYMTRFNGTVEEFFLVSPETFAIQGQGTLPFSSFVVGCYGIDPNANELLFHGIANGTASISTINMATGQISGTFSKPSYIQSPLLPAYDPVTDKYFGVGGIGSLRMALLEFRKTDYQIDTLGVIPGMTAVSIVGSALDVVNRRLIFVTSLNIFSVNVDNPSDVQILPYPQPALNVKGFQSNYFAAPSLIPRPGGELHSIFKNVSGWYRDGLLIPGTENVQTYSPTMAGIYHYKVTRPDGSSANSNTFAITSVAGSKINNQVTICPNPATDRIMVKKSKNTELPYSITNSQGKVVLTGTLSQYESEIEVQKLSSGIYHFITSNSDSPPQKIVIQ